MLPVAPDTGTSTVNLRDFSVIGQGKPRRQLGFRGCDFELRRGLAHRVGRPASAGQKVSDRISTLTHGLDTSTPAQTEAPSACWCSCERSCGVRYDIPITIAVALGSIAFRPIATVRRAPFRAEIEFPSHARLAAKRASDRDRVRRTRVPGGPARPRAKHQAGAGSAPRASGENMTQSAG